jgi:hypothetical protein
MCPNARGASDFLFPTIVETLRGKLSDSWSRVGIRDDGIEDVETLSVWKCGSHLYGLQKFEVYLYPTRSEHEAKKMARANQRL